MNPTDAMINEESLDFYCLWRFNCPNLKNIRNVSKIVKEDESIATSEKDLANEPYKYVATMRLSEM